MTIKLFIGCNGLDTFGNGQGDMGILVIALRVVNDQHVNLVGGQATDDMQRLDLSFSVIQALEAIADSRMIVELIR